MTKVLSLMAAIAVLSLGSAVAAEPERDAGRRGLWERLGAALDRGEAAPTAVALEPLLAVHPDRFELADLHARARRRLCDADVRGASLAALATSFAVAADLRRRDRHAEAGEAFARLGTTDDPWSRAVVLLNAAECLTVADRRPRATALLDTVDALVGRAEVPERLALRSMSLRAKLLRMEAAPGALALFERVLARAERLGARSVECDCLAGIGTRETNTLALREAERLGDPDRMIRILVNLAFGSGDWSVGGISSRHLDRADSVLAVCPRPFLAGYVEAGRGHISRNLEGRKLAIRHLSAAVAKHVAAGNHRGELTARQWLAYQLQMSGRYGEALENLEACLAILDEYDSRFIRDWVELGLGNVLRILGDPVAAIAHYEKAAALFAQADRDAMTTMCLAEMGSCYVLKGDYRGALRLFAEAAELDGVRNRRGMGSYILNFEGDCHVRLGDFNEALDHYERAVALAEERGYQSVLYAPLGGVAAVYAAVGRHEEAAAAYRRALEAATRHRDQEYEVRARIGMAEQALALGRNDEAVATLDEASDLLVTDGQFAFRSRILMLRARCVEDSSDAEALLERALESAVEGGLPEHEWNCLSALGDVRLARGDTAAAVALQERAVRVVESLRRRVGMDDLQRNLMTSAIAPYERLVDMLAADDPEAALAFAERSRARILAESMERSLGGVRTPSLELRELRASLSYALTRLQHHETDAAERDELRRQIRELESRAPLLAGAGSAPDADAPVESPVAALGSGECVLYYFLGEARSMLFTVDGSGVRAHVLPSRDEIGEKVRLFLGLRRRLSSGLPREVFRRSRAELRRMLLGPADQSVAACERLVLVPDGVLSRLPFALLDDEGESVVVDREPTIAPSLKVLAQLRRRDRDERGDGGVLVVGCRNASSGDVETRRHPFSDEPMPELPGADREAAAVGDAHAGAVVRTGADATEVALATVDWSRFELVHVAAHGYADARFPERSFIVLNRDDDAAVDGLLQRHEIAALDLDAALVVLSSCRSAGGPLNVGEGVTGLAQAFLDAGARCVLASLDDVPDDYASDFMMVLHRRLAEGDAPGEALRATRREIRERDAGGPSEHQWASFVLIGDPAGPDASSSRGVAGWLAAAIALAFVGAVVLLRRGT